MQPRTLVLAFLPLAALLYVRDGSAVAPPVPQPSARQMAKLVADLGADNFATREKASRALTAAGAEAVPALVKGMASADPEVRSRSLALARQAEKQATAYFEALGADVQRRVGSDRVAVVSYSQSDASKLRDEHLRELIGFPWLQRIGLDNAKIGDAGLAHLGRLPNLNDIVLTGTRITDDGLTHLAGLTNLKTLCLSKTRVTGRGLVHLRGMTRLQILDLDRSKLTDTGLAAGIAGLEDLDKLRTLILSGTQITDEGLGCLKGIKYRVGIFLADTRITDRGVPRLRAIPKLEVLSLSGIAITDKGCAALAEIKTLVVVYLHETRVTPAGLRQLKDMPALQHVSLYGVILTDKEVKDLTAILPTRIRLVGYGSPVAKKP